MSYMFGQTYVKQFKGGDMYNINDVVPKARIVKLVFTESKQYRDIWLRPYELHVDYADLNKVENVISRALGSGGVNNIPGMLDNEDPNILTPSGNVLGKANIINGWDTKRFKFVLVVEYTHTSSPITMVNYIQGYTDYMGISLHDTLDPNMMLIPNSVIVLRKRFDPTTGMISVVPIFNYNIVHDETHAVNNDFQSLKLARPEDVIAQINTLNIMEGEGDVAMATNIGSINNQEIVNKGHLLPVNHVGTTIKGVVSSKLTVGAFGGTEDVLDTAISEIIEPGISKIDFFRTLMNIRGLDAKTFTINDLTLIDGNVHNVTKVFMTNDPSMNVNAPTIMYSEDTAETYDASYETRISVLIHEATSALLSNSLLSTIMFEADNYNGEPHIDYLDSETYIDGLNKILASEQFVTMFMNKVWNNITNSNTSLLRIMVYGSLESDITITIEADGRAPVVYRYPTFADSKFLPLIMDNQNLEQVGEDYKSIVDTALNVTDNVMRKNSSIYTNY